MTHFDGGWNFVGGLVQGNPSSNFKTDFSVGSKVLVIAHHISAVWPGVCVCVCVCVCDILLGGSEYTINEFYGMT